MRTPNATSTHRLPRSSRIPELMLPPTKQAASDSAIATITKATRAGCEKNSAGPSQPITASARSAAVPSTTETSFAGQDIMVFRYARNVSLLRLPQHQREDRDDADEGRPAEPEPHLEVAVIARRQRFALLRRIGREV